MPDLPLSAGVSTSLNLHTDQAARKEPVGITTESFESVLRDKVKQSEAHAPEAAAATVVASPKSSLGSQPDTNEQAVESPALAPATDNLGALDPGLVNMLLQLQSGTTFNTMPDGTEPETVDNSSEVSIATDWRTEQSVTQTPARGTRHPEFFSLGTYETPITDSSDSVTGNLPVDQVSASHALGNMPFIVAANTVSDNAPAGQAKSTLTPENIPTSLINIPLSGNAPTNQRPVSPAPDPTVAALPSLVALGTNAANQKGGELGQEKSANARPTSAVKQGLAQMAISLQTSGQLPSPEDAFPSIPNTPTASTAQILVAKTADTLTTTTDQTNPSSGKSEFAHLLDRAGTSLAAAQLQPATQSAQSTTTITLQQPAGHAAWQNELGDKMVWMANSQRQQADLVLNPPQLGRVEVSLTISGDQASAVFTSPNAAVREMLENSLPRLREVFAGAGIDLGEAQVNTGQSQQQQAGNNHSYAGDNNSRNDRSGRGTVEFEQAGVGIIAPATTWSSSGKGLVDTFA